MKNVKSISRLFPLVSLVLLFSIGISAAPAKSYPGVVCYEYNGEFIYCSGTIEESENGEKFLKPTCYYCATNIRVEIDDRSLDLSQNIERMGATRAICYKNNADSVPVHCCCCNKIFCPPPLSRRGD